MFSIIHKRQIPSAFIGTAVGLIGVILCFLYVEFHLGFDRQWGADSYRIESRFEIPGRLWLVVLATLILSALAAIHPALRIASLRPVRVLRHGASSWRVFGHALGSYARPVLAGNLIALPIAALLMARWLEGFVVRIDLSALPFAIAVIACAFVALVTTVGQAVRVSRIHPGWLLRSE